MLIIGNLIKMIKNIYLKLKDKDLNKPYLELKKQIQNYIIN